ncbi:MAG: BlaI/MecI/CopY family transcriptional regulator [Prevotella sp.]|nr:BlaI/MecI/CopY family transcriptional regulator [Prevotella sp.]
MKENKTLTKAETQVMNALWSLPDGQGRSAEIMEQMPEPKPALTTLLTFLKILKDKGFIAAEKIGKGQLFKATVSRNDYTRTYMKEVKNTFFGGSVASLVSFFAKNEELSQQEIDEIMDIIKHQKNQ